jgi:hypothetical protein
MPLKQDGVLTGGEYMRSWGAKNAGILHMAKVYCKDRPWWVKIAEVCLLLIDGKISLEFCFIVPQEFVSAPDLLLSGRWMFEILEDFQRRALSINMSQAIESGPIMEGNNTPEIIVNSGLDAFCLHGSFQDQNKILSRTSN